MISTKNVEQAKNLIKRATERPIIVEAQDDSFNRKLLEYGKLDILLGIEKGSRKDGLRQLDSGMNEFLAKLAAKNKVAIGIDLEDLNKESKRQKALRIGRIMQNVRLCRKAKCKLKLINYKNKINAQAFLMSLGASSQQAKEAL
jgi:RNase P/RNase MRP subunit p30